MYIKLKNNLNDCNLDKKKYIEIVKVYLYTLESNIYSKLVRLNNIVIKVTIIMSQNQICKIDLLYQSSFYLSLFVIN